MESTSAGEEDVTRRREKCFEPQKKMLDGPSPPMAGAAIVPLIDEVSYAARVKYPRGTLANGAEHVI